MNIKSCHELNNIFYEHQSWVRIAALVITWGHLPHDSRHTHTHSTPPIQYDLNNINHD